MPIRTESSVVKSLLRSQNRSVSGFAVDLGVDRTNIHRSYLSGSMPEPEHRVHGFCRELNVDPHALLPLEDEEYVVSKFWIERHRHLSSANRKDEAPKPLRALWELTAPRNDWPMDSYSSKHYQRTWSTSFLRHRPSDYEMPSGEGGYARLKIRGTEAKTHQVFHLAWKIADSTDLSWSYFGLLVQRNNIVFRVDSRGVQKAKESINDGIMLAETWFGSGAADFKIASLHDFSTIDWEWSDDSLDVARFPLR